MAEDWEAYLTEIEDEPASIIVDLGAAVDAPQAERPRLVWAWIPMLNPGHAGLTNPEEAEALDAVEDALTAAFAERLNARMVGRVTVEERRELYFYAAAEGDPGVVAAEVLARFPDYECAADEDDDPNWSFYFETLYPDAVQMEGIRNRRQVEALSAGGDLLSVARPVDHWFAFPSAEERQAFVQEGAFIELTVVDMGEDEEEGQTLHRLHARAEHAAELAVVDQIVTDLFQRAAAHGGVYEGWECPVVADESPSPGDEAS